MINKLYKLTFELTIGLIVASVIGVLSGAASALFLYLLDLATRFREAHLWMIALLPLAGLGIGLVYHSYGKSLESGSTLVVDEIHDPKKDIPLRLAPLVLLATVVTHLFGGSAGREGTAIQMGASLADQLNRPLRKLNYHRRTLLMAGLSAGFGSVFGTPLAGAVFGLEVLRLKGERARSVLPCLVAAYVGNFVTLSLGIHHTVYVLPDLAIPSVTIVILFYSALAGLCFGGAGIIFVQFTHAINLVSKKLIAHPPWRPLVGGALVASLVALVGTTRYIGLGIPVIVEAFQKPLPIRDFLGKIFFTSLTLGTGFKGGEVTPLFFIGATLGNTLSQWLPLAYPLLSAMGFVAVFAGAANTPISSTIMAMEIFGPKVGIFAAIACGVSYACTSKKGIYHSKTHYTIP